MQLVTLIVESHSSDLYYWWRPDRPTNQWPGCERIKQWAFNLESSTWQHLIGGRWERPTSGDTSVSQLIHKSGKMIMTQLTFRAVIYTFCHKISQAGEYSTTHCDHFKRYSVTTLSLCLWDKAFQLQSDSDSEKSIWAHLCFFSAASYSGLTPATRKLSSLLTMKCSTLVQLVKKHSRDTQVSWGILQHHCDVSWAVMEIPCQYITSHDCHRPSHVQQMSHDLNLQASFLLLSFERNSR